MGKITPAPIRVGTTPVLGGLDSYLLTKLSNTLVQARQFGLYEVLWDSSSSGTLMSVYNGAASLGASSAGFYTDVSPGFTLANSSGLFALYTTGVEAEILNVFSDDRMYIGPYYDRYASNFGETVTYRAGWGNEGDGTWFAGGPFASFAFNCGVADFEGVIDACFFVQGLSGYPSRPVHQINAIALGTVVQRLSTATTNSDPTQDVVQGRVATTDATVTTLHTFTVPASTTYAIEAVVIARRKGGASGTAEDGARYVLKAVYKNVAGTATIIGAIGVEEDESVAGYNATLTVSGATVLCRVTGVATTNITWHMTARTWGVST